MQMQPATIRAYFCVDRLILGAIFFTNGIGYLIDPQKLATVDVHYVYEHWDKFFSIIHYVGAYKARLIADVPQPQDHRLRGLASGRDGYVANFSAVAITSFSYLHQEQPLYQTWLKDLASTS